MKGNQITASLLSAFFALACVTTSQAAANLASATISSQSPAVATRGGLCYFPLTFTRAGIGSLAVYLSVSGLPADFEYSFVPPDVSFAQNDRSTKYAKMLVRVPLTAPNGQYNLTITARHGNSPATIQTSATLIVGADSVVVTPPLMSTPVRQTDGSLLLSGTGTPSIPVLVQATTNLTDSTSWVTISLDSTDEKGLFSFVDQDAKSLPSRFYRAVQ